jgi:hypothetical protein
MRAVSIGHWREDGDFAILATLNNNDELINGFKELVEIVRFRVALQSGRDDIITLERQDAPDYVDAVAAEQEYGQLVSSLTTCGQPMES